jgi:hypothetical protein
LHEAIWYTKPDQTRAIVKILLEYGADPNAYDNNKLSPLELAEKIQENEKYWDEKLVAVSTSAIPILKSFKEKSILTSGSLLEPSNNKILGKNEPNKIQDAIESQGSRRRRTL